MKWKKGESGNPGGRKPGTGKVEKLRAAIAKDMPDILQAMVDAAKSGDVAAGKVLLDRVCPPLKAEERAVAIALPDDGLLPQAQAALAALSAGAIAPGQLASIMAALAGVARIYELTELEVRVGALEAERDRES